MIFASSEVSNFKDLGRIMFLVRLFSWIPWPRCCELENRKDLSVPSSTLYPEYQSLNFYFFGSGIGFGSGIYFTSQLQLPKFVLFPEARKVTAGDSLHHLEKNSH